MSTGAPRFAFALSASAITYSLTLVGAVVLILGAAWLLIGPATAHAGYLAIMFLLSPARAPSLRMRAAVAGWAVLVATLGFMVGPLGLWPTLIVLVVICVIQGLFKVGEVASLTRSPVNFIAFAGLSHAEAELWQVILGSVIGAVFVVALVALLPAKKVDPLPPIDIRDRLDYGLLVAAGSVVIVIVAEIIDFPFVGWVLLSFCMTLAVGFDNRTSRARDRVIGTIAGALGATLVTLLPAPGPVIGAALSLILCVAYLRSGNYTMFVAFLTPSILLTVGSEYSASTLGVLRIEAVLAAAVVAIACSLIFEHIRQRRTMRIARATSDRV